MTQRVVAFTGISGVGKTTFLKELERQVSFQHLTGGSLIAAARQIEHGQRDKLRHANLDENQQLLINGFLVTRDPQAALIVMDGHVVIDDGNSLTKLPSEVFHALGTSLMVHLEADPARIAANRSRDTSRSRPNLPPENLRQQQSTSNAHARSISHDLGIEFQSVTHDDVSRLAALLMQ